MYAKLYRNPRPPDCLSGCAPSPSGAPHADSGLFVGALFRKMPKADGRQIRLCADERRGRPLPCARPSPSRARRVCQYLHAVRNAARDGAHADVPRGAFRLRRLHGLPACLRRARGGLRHPGELLLLSQDDARHGGNRRAAQAADDRRNDARLRREPALLPAAGRALSRAADDHRRARPRGRRCRGLCRRPASRHDAQAGSPDRAEARRGEAAQVDGLRRPHAKADARICRPARGGHAGHDDDGRTVQPDCDALPSRPRGRRKLRPRID